MPIYLWILDISRHETESTRITITPLHLEISHQVGFHPQKMFISDSCVLTMSQTNPHKILIEYNFNLIDMLFACSKGSMVSYV